MTAGLHFACAEHHLCNNTCARARCCCPYLPRCLTAHFIVLLTAYKASYSLTPSCLLHPSNPACLLSLQSIQISPPHQIEPKPKSLLWWISHIFCHILWLCTRVLFQCKLDSLMVEIGQILHIKTTSSAFDLWLYHLFVCARACACFCDWWCMWLKEDVHSNDGQSGDQMFSEYIELSWHIKDTGLSNTESGKWLENMHSRFPSPRLYCCPTQRAARLHMALSLNRMDILFLHCGTWHSNEVKQLKWQKGKGLHQRITPTIMYSIMLFHFRPSITFPNAYREVG